MMSADLEVEYHPESIGPIEETSINSAPAEEEPLANHRGKKHEEVVPGSKWLKIKKPQRARPNMNSEELAQFATKLNAELLAEVESLPAQFDMAHSQKFDTMNRAGHYNATADSIITNGFALVRRDDERRAADKGPSCSKDRFSSNYWKTWNGDYILLEDLSRTEEEAEKERLRILGAKKSPPPKNPKLRKITPIERSKIAANTFGLPKSDRSDFFDLHQQGNRNHPLMLWTKSLKADVPKALYCSALLNSHANVDPDATGRRALKGGVINTGPARPPAPKILTAGCDVPPVNKPAGSHKLTKFSSCGRSGALFGQNAAPGRGTMSEYKMPSNAIGFARAPRTTDEMSQSNGDVPGAGTYEVARMFEGKNDPKPRDLSYALLVLQNSKDYRDIGEVELSKFVGFGFGCSRQEHILYGSCLDGLCGRRSQVEQSMLKTKQFRRLGAPSAASLNQLLYCRDTTPRVTRVGAVGGSGGSESGAKSASVVGSTQAQTAQSASSPWSGDHHLNDHSQVQRSEEQRALLMAHRKMKQQGRQKLRDLEHWHEERRVWTETLVPPPNEKLPPLHMAAFRGDCDAIVKMARLRVTGDVNERQGDLLDTPLIVATRKGHLAAVKALIDTFAGQIDVDAQNALGDTALHCASRGNRAEIVQESVEANAITSLRNKEGRLPIDETKRHKIKAIISIQSDYESLHYELRNLKREASKLSTKRSGAGISSGSGSGGVEEAYNNVDPGTERVLTITSRGESRGGSSRGSERSRIMELGEDTHWDEAREKIKVNRSMYAVSATPTTLADPKKNSYCVGYFPPEPEKRKPNIF